MDHDVAARETGANAAVVERVLDAERNVESRLQAAVDEVDRVLRAARARADAIRIRTDERISRLHVAMESRLERKIAEMRREFLQTEESPENDPHLGLKRDALQRAVRRLAARMTGEEGEVAR